MSKYRRYAVNVKFFDSWSQQMAYCLGFASADGNVYKGTLRFEIQKRDCDALNFVKDCISPQSPICETKEGEYVRLSINSIDLVGSLVQYNVIPDKSKKIRANFQIPTDFVGSYVRGVFDGDGWVCCRRKQIECGICSASSGFLDDIRTMCGNIGRLRERCKNGNLIYCWEMDKRHSLVLKDLMYENDCFSLKRKKERFFGYRFVPDSSRWNEDQIDYLTKHYVSGKNSNYKKIAEYLKKSHKSVSKKIWELNLVSESLDRSNNCNYSSTT